MAPPPPAPTLSPHAIRDLRDTLVRLTIPLQIHDRATFRTLALRHIATLVHPEMLVPGLVADTASQLGGELAATFMNLYGERLWPGQVIADPRGTVRRYALGPGLAEYFTALLQLPAVLVESPDAMVERLVRSREGTEDGLPAGGRPRSASAPPRLPTQPSSDATLNARMTGVQLEVQDDGDEWDTDSADESEGEEEEKEDGKGKVRSTPTKVTPAADGSQGGKERDILICGLPVGLDEDRNDLKCEERFQGRAALDGHRRKDHQFTDE
ncbi:hypothetical protein LTR97_007183 [Elasticomyces elasticus]|uniref:Uncharacterized protein n=1 Tax=Elasticomyces elasticus TaxID=574655 RepID=A0AAN7ZN34_9PEZI|nr:hypothetical protein LTR97_007183 [Elasticomyces elasticus]